MGKSLDYNPEISRKQLSPTCEKHTGGAPGALISIVTGTALTGLPFLIAHWFPINNLFGKALYVLAFPGMFAILLMVGVHGDGGWKVAASGLSVNAIVYGAIVFLVVRKKVAK